MMLQRKVTPSLSIYMAGQEYDVSQVPGITAGELVDAELTENGLRIRQQGNHANRASIQSFTETVLHLGATAVELRNGYGFPINARPLGQHPARICHAAACTTCTGVHQPAQPPTVAPSVAQQAYAVHLAKATSASSAQGPLHQGHDALQAQQLSASQLALKLEYDLQLAASAVANLQATLGQFFQFRDS